MFHRILLPLLLRRPVAGEASSEPVCDAGHMIVRTSARGCARSDTHSIRAGILLLSIFFRGNDNHGSDQPIGAEDRCSDGDEAPSEQDPVRPLDKGEGTLRIAV